MSCLHCYSASSPRVRGALDLRLLCDAVSAAARAGYNVLSLSGGEPLLYKPLLELLQHARAQGMRTAVTSNGMLLTTRQVDRLREAIDMLAISLDGVPASHNRMRGSALAFDTMKARLPMLRAAGIDFGFIFTLTQHNLDELDWVREFALEQGAKLLQVHPLEEAGNAMQQLDGSVPDATESAYAWFLGQQKVDAGMSMQVDLAFSEYIKQHPEAVFAHPAMLDASKPFGELIAPLVIEADATVVPIQYGFARDYAIGNLNDAPLAALMQHWRTQRLPAFYALCREVFEEIAASTQPHFLNWNELLSKRAERLALVPA